MSLAVGRMVHYTTTPLGDNTAKTEKGRKYAAT
jgi:hypothetical protein